MIDPEDTNKFPDPDGSGSNGPGNNEIESDPERVPSEIPPLPPEEIPPVPIDDPVPVDEPAPIEEPSDDPQRIA